jgi:hypothetical protein
MRHDGHAAFAAAADVAPRAASRQMRYAPGARQPPLPRHAMRYAFRALLS